MKKRKKRGQVWIETVLYTLIAFVMIGLVLAFAKPKIEEMQDKAIIEQSLGMMEEITNIVSSMGVAGNQRVLEIRIKKGSLKIDGAKDKIVFEIESRHTYSEVGKDVVVGNIIVNTKKRGKLNLITLTSELGDSNNVTYKNEDAEKIISRSSTPYKLFISNVGEEKMEGDLCSDLSPCPIKEGYSKKVCTNGVCKYSGRNIIEMNIG